MASGIVCPALVNGTEVTFTVDSGADVSAIDSQSAADLGLEVIPQPLELTPVGEGTVKSPGYVIVRKLDVGQVTLSDVRLIVADIASCCAPGVGLIGLDLFPNLNFSVVGVPAFFPRTYENDEREPDVPIVTKDMTPYMAPAQDRDLLMARIQPLLEENAAIASDSLCTHPSALVTLDTGDARPVYIPQYKLSDYMSECVDKQVKIWDVNRVTVPAPPDSPWNNPIIGALDEAGRRAGKEPRICIDPRRLNDLLPDDPRGLPTVEAIHRRLYGFDYITEVDLTKSFNQFTVAEWDRLKTTFTWRGFKRMFRGSPFGLKTLSQLFQSVIEQIFHKDRDVTAPFIDNIYVHTKGSIEVHIDAVRRVLMLLNKYKLRINIKKCFFGYKAVLVLGHLLTSTTKSVDINKVSALKEWPRPRTGKDIESFLGFCNYLRDFVPLYANIASPLEKLRKVKKIGNLWDESCEQSFQMFKNVLSQAPVLNMPLPDVPYCIATDASQLGLGWVLYQLDPATQKPRYIKFGAKSLNKHQQNYGATRRELLAVVTAIQDCRDYVYGKKFDLFTDHKSLTYLFTQTKLNYMQLNCIDVLLDYNFVINHRPGVQMVLPDGLSRMFRNFSSSRGGCGVASEDKLPACRRLQLSDSTQTPDKVTWGATSEDKLPACRRLRLSELPRAPDKELNEFVKERFNKTFLVEEERQAKLEAAHAKGHFGADALFRAMWDQGYYWPGMRSECETLVNSCMPCLRFNIGKAGYHPAQYIDARRPFEHIAIDTISGFETTERGNNYILVVTDICTRFKIVYPQQTKEQGETARNLWNMLCTFPTPKIIQSDNGTEFCNQVISELTSLHGVLHKTIVAYNPRANGTAENAVGSVQDVLHKLTNGVMTDWDLFLPAVQLSLNAKPNATTQCSPATLLFGMNVGDFANFDRSTSRLFSDDELAERATFLNDVLRPEAHSRFRKEQSKRAAARTRQKRQVKPLPIGTMVMLNDPTRENKHQPKYSGPFKIVKQKRGGNYVLQHPDNTLHHREPTIDQLKVINANSDVPYVDTYYVERILTHRGTGKNLEYKVKWLNYPTSENTWEPPSSLVGCDRSIDDYWGTQRGTSTSSSSSSSSTVSQQGSKTTASKAPASKASSGKSRKRKRDN